jgi:hypothetical protein
MDISEVLAEVLIAEVVPCPFNEGLALFEGAFVVGGIEE